MFEQRRNFDLRRLLGGLVALEPAWFRVLIVYYRRRAFPLFSPFQTGMGYGDEHLLSTLLKVRSRIEEGGRGYPRPSLQDQGAHAYTSTPDGLNLTCRLVGDAVCHLGCARTCDYSGQAKEALYPSIWYGKIKSVPPSWRANESADLHILVNTIHSPSILNNSAAASWLPVCLPKFNAAAFVNAYVMFLPHGDVPNTPQDLPSEGEAESTAASSESDDAASTQSQPIGIATERRAEVGLICVSGNADFEAVRAWCETVSTVRCILRSRPFTPLT